ncbi:hypothetical protein GCM10011391_27050 [Pullulanibacillus camelliae]|uniref:Alkaliphily related protein n=1 Tax=Pullulanibacillus camelliae TaxID=1707096 RepID=A0A8J2YJC7_9BACL|nr:DUF2759 domain-containing protein [Pullulanibacillus camelliae]GGE46795.1 hypothetical protein GCM10011391_27050 [Pullulanibacillus camelliae]
MVIGVIFLIIAILCLLAIFREAKRRNFFGAGYALITCVVLGWFSIMTIIDVLNGGGVDVGG